MNSPKQQIETIKRSLTESFNLTPAEQQLLDASLSGLSAQHQKHTVSFIQTALEQHQPSDSGLPTTHLPCTLYFLVQAHLGTLQNPGAQAAERETARGAIIKPFNNRQLFKDLFSQLDREERLRIIDSGLRVVGPRLLAQYRGLAKFPNYWQKEWIETSTTAEKPRAAARRRDARQTNKIPEPPETPTTITEARSPGDKPSLQGFHTATPTKASQEPAHTQRQQGAIETQTHELIAAPPFDYTLLHTRLAQSPILEGRFKEVFQKLSEAARVSDLVDLGNLSPYFVRNALQATSSKQDFARDFFHELANITSPASPALTLLMAPLSEKSVWGHIPEAVCSNLAKTSVLPSFVYAKRLLENNFDRLKVTPIDNGLRLWQFLLRQSRDPHASPLPISSELNTRIIEDFRAVGLQIAVRGTKKKSTPASKPKQKEQPATLLAETEPVTETPPPAPAQAIQSPPSVNSQPTTQPFPTPTPPQQSAGTIPASVRLTPQLCVALPSRIDHRHWLAPDILEGFKQLEVSHLFALANLEPQQIETVILNHLQQPRSINARRSKAATTDKELAEKLEQFYSQLKTVGKQTIPAASLLVAPLTAPVYWGRLSADSRYILAGYRVHISQIRQSRLQEDTSRAKLPVNNGLRLLQLLVIESARVATRSDSHSLAKKLELDQRQLIHTTLDDVGMWWKEFDWLLD